MLEIPRQRGSGKGPRPHTWLTGPNELRHIQYNAWHKARAQVHYRKEIWLLEFIEWEALWEGQWHRRGRTKNALVLMKKEWQQPWTKSNCELVDRLVFNRRQIKIKGERKALRLEGARDV